MRLWVYKVIAVVSLLLAFAGVLLPGLPATEFVILSAWASAKGSPTIYRFLMSRPFFRDMITNWQNGKIISRRNKWLSTVSISVCFAILMLHKAPLWIVWSASLGMLIALVIIWRRPESLAQVRVKPVTPEQK
ncbi:YbaN family protein [Vibrio zhugei]|uniref:YbaN family protein n=1 Tax=Vibrio zhugei TaxID=2479546 RepID=A0ABV7CAD4_9VIBR|nr:YbaN family protein [Vibrio zhugei]